MLEWRLCGAVKWLAVHLRFMGDSKLELGIKYVISLWNIVTMATKVTKKVYNDHFMRFFIMQKKTYTNVSYIVEIDHFLKHTWKSYMKKTWFAFFMMSLFCKQKNKNV